MARVTVEDCIQVIPNRYELVLLSAQRARDISSGAPITVDRDNDKNPVIALREIAEQTINMEEVRKHIIEGVNRMGDVNQEDEALLAIAGAGIESEVAEASVGVAIEEVPFENIEGPEEAAAADVDEETGDLAGDDFAAAGDDLDLAGAGDIPDLGSADENL